jgi:hypothetical protein
LRAVVAEAAHPQPGLLRSARQLLR